MTENIQRVEPQVVCETSPILPHAIVFFDGICGFCNSSVNFLISHDRRRRLRFAPLQGQTAADCLPPELYADLDSIVFLRNRQIYVRSAAVVQVLQTMGGIWVLAAWLLWLCPLPLRDLGYRMIARVRYRLFGKHESCRLPTPEERGLILE